MNTTLMDGHQPIATSENKPRLNETTHAFGRTPIDKIAKFGWTVVDQPGEYEMIDKSLLFVDYSYQRSTIRNKTILAIAREFSWIAFGVIIVVRRKGNQLWVVDGQHRLLVVLKRSDIQAVPCLVFDERDIRGEAAAFQSVNEHRGHVSSVDKFKAACVAGDDVANKVKSLLLKNGLAASSTRAANTIDCIGSVMQMARTDMGALEVALPIAIAVSDGQIVPEIILFAFFYLARAYPDEFASPHVGARMKSLGRAALLRAAHEAAAFFTKGGQKVWATGIAKAYNKGLRKNRLPLADNI